MRRTYKYLVDSAEIGARVSRYVVEGEHVAVIFTSTGRIQDRTFAVQIANFFIVRDGLIEVDDGVYDTGGRPCSP